MNKQILIAGFGGQGILFSGKFLAYEGLLDGKNVTWLPSYGPEMRGGTAHCSVILSDSPVGSPIVDAPDALMVMNLPSLDKYEKTVVKGGKIFVDSTFIERKVERDDVDAYYVPATKLAAEAGVPTLANIILLGKVMKETGAVDFAGLEDVFKKIVSAKRADLIGANLKALELGYNYKD